MAATFSRLKNWVKEKLTYADLNAEIDNILTNFTPAGMDDFSANEAQMQQQTSPGTPGSPDLAESLGEEIERIRQVLADIKGETYWYSSADTNLQEVANALGGGLPTTRISSGRVRTNSSQLIALVPNGSAATVTLKGASTSFIAVIDSVALTISSDVNATSLQTAPASNNTALVNFGGLSGDPDWTKDLGHFNNKIPVDNVGSEISSLVGKTAAFSITNGTDTEYFLGKYNSNGYIEECHRGFGFDSSDNPVPAIGFSDNDTITLLKATWVFLKNDSTLVVTYNEPSVSKDEPSSPAIGDYWFDIENQTWKTFDSVQWNQAGVIYIGICAQDTSNTIVARTEDQFVNNTKNVEPLNLRYTGSTTTEAKDEGYSAIVFGQTVRFYNDRPVWDMGTDLDSGISEAATTMYFLYLTEEGDTVISDQAPRVFAARKGLYHPHHTWFCVGSVFNNASSDFDSVVSYSNLNQDNYDFIDTRSGSANYFWGHFNPLVVYRMGVRNGNVQSYEEFQMYCHAPVCNVPSGSTLGHRDGKKDAVFVYVTTGAVYFNPILGFSSLIWPQGERNIFTLAGTGADDGSLYWNFTTAGSNLNYKIFAFYQYDNATAGTWSASFSNKEITHNPRWRNIRYATNVMAFTTSSATEVGITNGTVPINLTGKYPIRIGFAASTSAGYLKVATGGGTSFAAGYIRLRQDSTSGTILVSQEIAQEANYTGEFQTTPCTAIDSIVRAANFSSGNRTFYATAQRNGGSASDTVQVANARLYVEEINDGNTAEE